MVDGQLNKVVVIVQARMQSTRLPGKVLMPMPIFGEKTILDQIVDQLRRSKYKLDIVLATSVLDIDDQIAEFCSKNGIQFFRGDEENVHSRFYEILKISKKDVGIRITGDNPFIDIDHIDFALDHYFNETIYDYSYTSGLPLGMNFEIFSISSFMKLSDMKLTSFEQEHVTLKYKADESFNISEIIFDVNIDKVVRVTVDYPSDYLVVSTLFQLSEKNKIKPRLDVIMYALKNYSWLFELNQNNLQRV
ncbi:cytidylyltransferase domain-containing protein [Aquirufa lenticrescens]